MDKQRCKANGMQMSDGVLNLFLQTVDHDMEIWMASCKS